MKPLTPKQWLDFFDSLRRHDLTKQDLRAARFSAAVAHGNPCGGCRIPHSLPDYFDRIQRILDFSSAIQRNDWQTAERIFETAREKWPLSDRETTQRSASPRDSGEDVGLSR